MLRKRLPLSQPVEPIKTDEQLAQEAKYNNHQRQQDFEEAVNWVVCMAVKWVPLSIFAVGIIYVGHLAWVGDWEAYRSVLFAVGYVVMGYLISALQQRGLTPNRPQ